LATETSARKKEKSPEKGCPGVDRAILDHMFDVTAEVRRLSEATASLASRDLSGLSDHERLAAVRALSTTVAMNESILGQLLAGLEADGVCDRDFGMGTATWAAHETHGDRRVAATRVNVGTKLRGPLAETGELWRGVTSVLSTLGRWPMPRIRGSWI